MNFRIVPTTIFGVTFYAVEDQGYTERYCDTREDAERRCEELSTPIQGERSDTLE